MTYPYDILVRKVETMRMKKRTIRNITLTAVFAAVLCIAAPFPIPIGPIPITLSLFAVFLCGAVLPPPYAVSATLVYLVLGVIGLPFSPDLRAASENSSVRPAAFCGRTPLWRW